MNLIFITLLIACGEDLMTTFDNFYQICYQWQSWMMELIATVVTKLKSSLESVIHRAKLFCITSILKILAKVLKKKTKTNKQKKHATKFFLV